MARVEKKPTYRNNIKATISAWCLAYEDPWLSEVLGIGCDSITADIRDEVDLRSCTNVGIDDMLYAQDPLASMIASRVKRDTINRRAKVAREWLTAVIKAHQQVFWGSDAAVFLAKHMMQVRYHQIDRVTWSQVNNVIIDIISSVAQDFKLDDVALLEAKRIIMKDQLIHRYVAIAQNTRHFLSSSIDKACFMEQLCVTLDPKFEDVFQQLKDKEPIDRFRTDRDRAESYGLSKWGVSGISVYSDGINVYFLDHESKEKARKIVQSIACAYTWKSFDESRRGITSNKRLQANTVMSIMTKILDDACKMVKRGKCYSVISKSMKTYFLSIIQNHSEGNDMFDRYSQARTALLVQSAKDLWPNVMVIAGMTDRLSDEDRLEAFKLANILPAVDTDAMSMKKRLEEVTKAKRSVDTAEWANFMRFVKIYDIANYVVNKRAVPNYEGEELDPDWIERWMKGHWFIPKEEFWGKSYMIDCFTDSSKIDEYWLDAKDVTWVGHNEGVATEISNELKVAWEYGPKIDKIHDARGAFRYDLEHGTVAYWAPKAENHKSNNNQRLIASGSSGARAGISVAEYAQRMNSGLTPGFAQGLDAIRLGKKVQGMLDHMKNDPGCFISSHDIKGWSEFEDRTAKNEYIQYECNKYTDPVLKHAGDTWDNIISVLKKAGVRWSGPFETGGIQGWNGVLDSIMHSKIVAYVHQKAHAGEWVRSAAQLLVCIDDVAYDASLRGRMDEAKVNRVLGSMVQTYENLAYFIDNTKSIHGKRKMVFLSDVYLDAMYVSTPIKVAIKADTDMQSKVKTTQDDWAAWMSTASAIACNGGDALCAYLFGTVFATYDLLSKHRVLRNASSYGVAAWLLMPQSEGGMGHPSLRVFTTGGDSDPSYAWRDMIISSGRRDIIQAMCNLSGYLLEPNTAEQTVRNPIGIRHGTKPSGSVVRRTAISVAMDAVPHDPVWDKIRDAGEVAIEKLAEVMSNDAVSADMVSLYDITANLPHALYEELLDKFSSTGAISSILKRRQVWRIARTCARADHKWINEINKIVSMDGLQVFDDAWVETREIRASLNQHIMLVNSVIPTPSSAVCVSSSSEKKDLQSTANDFVVVDATSIKCPRNRSREDQMGSKFGRTPGFRSDGGCWTDMGKLLRKDIIGKKLVQVAAVLRTLAYRNVDIAALSTIFSNAWGLNYDVHEINACPPQVHPKRVCSLTCKATHMALAYRNVYSAAKCRTDGLYKFIKDECVTSLVDPMAVAHMMKLSALFASVNAGQVRFLDVCWEFQPSPKIDWAYLVTDTMFTIEQTVLPRADLDHLGLKVPDREELAALVAHSSVEEAALQPIGIGEHTAMHYNTVLYRAKSTGGKALTSDRSVHYKPVPRGLVKDYSAAAGMVDAIIRFRVNEVCDKNKIQVERIIWQDIDGDPAPACKFVAKLELWENVIKDVSAMVHTPGDLLKHKMVAITKDHNISCGDPAVISSALGRNLFARHQLIRHAHQGIVGNTPKSYKTRMAYMIVSPNFKEVNAKHRRSNALKRAETLKRKYHACTAAKKSASIRSFYAGRLLVRKMTTYDDEMNPGINEKSAREFLESTIGVSDVSLADDSSYSDNIEKLTDYNAANVKKSQDAVAFGEGMSLEADYVMRDAETAQNTTYAVPPYDSGVHAEKRSRWVLHAFAEVDKSAGKSRSLADMAMAIGRLAVDPGKTKVDLSAMFEDDIDDDDEDEFAIIT